jgi:hypothetical protein
MALTPAEKQSRYRARQRERLEALERDATAIMRLTRKANGEAATLLIAALHPVMGDAAKMAAIIKAWPAMPYKERFALAKGHDALPPKANVGFRLAEARELRKLGCG